MHSRMLLGAVAVAGGLVVLGRMSADGRPASGDDAPLGSAPAPAERGGAAGPDVITFDVRAPQRWATDENETAYSLATVACNVGDMSLDWVAGDGPHPVIGQNLYRYTPLDGRFEQLGQSWVKHAFCALQQRECDDCRGGGGCLDFLLPRCSDVYSATRNGQQRGLGPKWQVNAHTGAYAWPRHEGEGEEGLYRRRLRVRTADMLAPAALFFMEGQFVAADDAAWGNQNNNVSHRQAAVDLDTMWLVAAGATQVTRPAIEAWRDLDPGVAIERVQVPGDGLLVLGSRARDNGDGTWSYEYALYNMNAHRSARAFRVPVPDDATVTAVGFHDVDYHSGDGIDGVNVDGTDWPGVRADGAVTWTTDAFAVDPNANALRWGTLYNFRFTADAPPVAATGVVTLFRPGSPPTLCVETVSPGAGADPCPADVDGSGVVDFRDVVAVLARWGPCCGCAADVDGSGVVDFQDVVAVLAAWGGCP